MTADQAHVDDRLDDWLDRRLDQAARREVEDHLAACARCRSLGEDLLAAREALRSALADVELPPDLEARIGAALDREDESVEGSAPAPHPPAPAAAPRPPAWSMRRMLPLAAAIALALLGLWLFAGPRASAGDPVAAAFAQYAALAGPEPPPALAAADAAEIERRWRAAGIDFPARVLDLSAMGIAVAGGDASRLAGTPAARALYRGDGVVYVCWMFRGDERTLPPPVESRAHGGFEFHVYRRGATTLVVWREGAVLCALAGEGDSERVVGLAFAKAMAPAGASGAGGRAAG